MSPRTHTQRMLAWGRVRRRLLLAETTRGVIDIRPYLPPDAPRYAGGPRNAAIRTMDRTPKGAA